MILARGLAGNSSTNATVVTNYDIPMTGIGTLLSSVRELGIADIGLDASLRWAPYCVLAVCTARTQHRNLAFCCRIKQFNGQLY